MQRTRGLFDAFHPIQASSHQPAVGNEKKYERLVNHSSPTKLSTFSFSIPSIHSPVFIVFVLSQPGAALPSDFLVFYLCLL